jgi:hypothetical protein
LLSEAGGMQEIQRLLAERDVEVMDAIIITRELLGAGPNSLTQATAVLTSSSRKAELRHHEHLIDDLAAASDQSDDR